MLLYTFDCEDEVTMISLLKKEKKTIILSALLAFLLIIFDLWTKNFILRFWGDKLDKCNNEGSFIHFHPVYNEAGNTLSLKTGLTFSKNIFFALCLIGAVFTVFYYLYFLYIKNILDLNLLCVVPLVFLFAGIMARLIERPIWRYTLDFIAIKNIGIIDFVDLYFLVAFIGILLMLIVSEVKDNAYLKELTKQQKKVFKKERLQKFWNLFRKQPSQNDSNV